MWLATGRTGKMYANVDTGSQEGSAFETET